MTAVAAIGGLVVGGALGFFLAAILTSGSRDDAFRAGYSAGMAQSLEGRAKALRADLDALQNYGGSE
jgi:hypothetical protein